MLRKRIHRHTKIFGVVIYPNYSVWIFRGIRIRICRFGLYIFGAQKKADLLVGSISFMVLPLFLNWRSFRLAKNCLLPFLFAFREEKNFYPDKPPWFIIIYGYT